jgi:1-acyl-sn-glycerol-3-phosphate acyltransferase
MTDHTITKEYRAYRKAFYFVAAMLALLFRLKPAGRGNIPDGPVMLCANHSSNFDPFIICIAAGMENQLHIMGKVELFKIPVFSWLIRKIGMFPVDRGNNDVGAIKTSLRYLKAGEKVVIFPEGTRVKSDNAVAVKTGALRIADAANVQIMPVYIPRKKPLWGKCPVIFGKPFDINPERKKMTSEDYHEKAGLLMEKILELKPEDNKRGERLRK